jgi:hypothetical protein
MNVLKFTGDYTQFGRNLVVADIRKKIGHLPKPLNAVFKPMRRGALLVLGIVKRIKAFEGLQI